MVFDGANQHVFITGSPGLGNSSIVVTDYTGAIVTTITGEAGAGGLAIDGSTLYVARCGWGVIDTIDLTTLTKTGSITAAAGGTCDIGIAGGRVWFSTDYQWGTLTSVTLATPHVTASYGSYYGAVFATAADAPNLLVVGEAGQSPTYTYAFDTSGGGLTPTGSSMDLGGAANLGQMSLTSDGAKMYMASGSPYQGQAFALPGFAAAGVYPTAPYPTAIAVTAVGSHVAVGEDGIYNPDVWLFASDSSTPMWKYDFNSTSDTVYQGGIGFTPDESALFVLSGDVSFDHTLKLSVFSGPTKASGSLTLTASRSTATYGQSVTLTAHLGTASANHSVSIYALPVGGARRLIATGEVAGDGTFSSSTTLARTTTFTAEWAGDSTYRLARSAGRTVGVHVVMASALSSSYGRAGAYHLYHYHASCPSNGTQCPIFAAAVKPNHAGKSVTFTLQRLTSSGWRIVGTAAVRLNSNSVAAVRFRYAPASKGHSYRLKAVYAGDADHLGGSTAWSYLRITS